MASSPLGTLASIQGYQNEGERITKRRLANMEAMNKFMQAKAELGESVSPGDAMRAAADLTGGSSLIYGYDSDHVTSSMVEAQNRRAQEEKNRQALAMIENKNNQRKQLQEILAGIKIQPDKPIQSQVLQAFPDIESIVSPMSGEELENLRKAGLSEAASKIRLDPNYQLATEENFDQLFPFLSEPVREALRAELPVHVQKREREMSGQIIDNLKADSEFFASLVSAGDTSLSYLIDGAINQQEEMLGTKLSQGAKEYIATRLRHARNETQNARFEKTSDSIQKLLQDPISNQHLRNLLSVGDMDAAIEFVRPWLGGNFDEQAARSLLGSFSKSFSVQEGAMRQQSLLKQGEELVQQHIEYGQKAVLQATAPKDDKKMSNEDIAKKKLATTLVHTYIVPPDRVDSVVTDIKTKLEDFDEGTIQARINEIAKKNGLFHMEDKGKYMASVYPSISMTDGKYSIQDTFVQMSNVMAKDIDGMSPDEIKKYGALMINQYSMAARRAYDYNSNRAFNEQQIKDTYIPLLREQIEAAIKIARKNQYRYPNQSNQILDREQLNPSTTILPRQEFNPNELSREGIEQYPGVPKKRNATSIDDLVPSPSNLFKFKMPPTSPEGGQGGGGGQGEQAPANDQTSVIMQLQQQLAELTTMMKSANAQPPSAQKNEELSQIMLAMQELQKQQADMVKQLVAMNGPRTILRDDNGKIIGSAPAQTA